MSELEDRLAKLEKIASDEKKLLEEAANRKCLQLIRLD